MLSNTLHLWSDIIPSLAESESSVSSGCLKMLQVLALGNVDTVG